MRTSNALPNAFIRMAKNKTAPLWKKLFVSSLRLKNTELITRAMTEFENAWTAVTLGSPLKRWNDLHRQSWTCCMYDRVYGDETRLMG
jgi:hypothetical protein